jgi:ribosomal protein S18 acetylase RimI-like enzyme
MSITLELATPASLSEVTEAVADWQRDGGPVQLHPGDLGWHWRLGAEELARAVQVWRRDGQILAVGLVDGSALIRMALAPSADRDDAFAAQLLADLSDPGRRGVLPADTAVVEARFGAAFRDLVRESGWVPDQPWTPLCRDLTKHVEGCQLRVEVVDGHHVEARVAVQRAAFPSSTFTAERWHAMAAAPPYRRARCLVGYDAHGDAVAAATVWSAGRGRPGLLEPVGVHRDHRGHGYGTAISVAAAAALRDMGASSATVCTPSSNVGAVATYVSAGFRRLPDVTDFRRTS